MHFNIATGHTLHVKLVVNFGLEESHSQPRINHIYTVGDDRWHSNDRVSII